MDAKLIPGYFPVISLSDCGSPVSMRVPSMNTFAGKNSLLFSLSREFALGKCIASRGTARLENLAASRHQLLVLSVPGMQLEPHVHHSLSQLARQIFVRLL